MKQGASGRDHGELLRLLFTDSNRRGIRVIDQACPQKPLFYDLCLPSDRYSITPLTIPRRRRFRWTHSTPARPSIKAINQRRARHQPAINVWASDCILVGHQTLILQLNPRNCTKERRGVPQTPSNAAASLLGAPRRRGRTWAGGQLLVWPVFALRKAHSKTERLVAAGIFTQVRLPGAKGVGGQQSSRSGAL